MEIINNVNVCMSHITGQSQYPGVEVSLFNIHKLNFINVIFLCFKDSENGEERIVRRPCSGTKQKPLGTGAW